MKNNVFQRFFYAKRECFLQQHKNEEAVKKHYSKYAWCSVSPASEYDIEVAKMKGMPIIEIETKKGGKGRYKDEAENIIHL